MSETAEPEVTPAEPEPAPAPEPAETPPAEPDKQSEPSKQEREERRIAQLTARMATLARERDELAHRLGALERQMQPQAAPQFTAEQQAAIDAEAERRAEAKLSQQRGAEFHQSGQAAFPDWQERCQSLVAMGADAGFADLLVNMPDGPRVAAALADQPEEVERIAAIRSERGRAIALGQFAARMERTRETQPAVTRAPAPIRPVTGRAQATFNEYGAGGQQLVEFYSKQAQERRQPR